MQAFHCVIVTKRSLQEVSEDRFFKVQYQDSEIMKHENVLPENQGLVNHLIEWF